MKKNLITVKKLSSSEQIEEAGVLLHHCYIEQLKWNFESINPSKLRIETSNDKKILIDRFSDKAIWFGVFDYDILVGCIRLCSVDEANKLEVEGYETSQPISKLIPQIDKNTCFEMTKLATRPDYIGKGIVKRLLLACFRYCEENHYSVITCTHNGYLNALYKKINFPLKREHAFKYEKQDPSPVNFYFADYKKLEIHEVMKNLEYLENDLSSNAHRIFRALETVEPILPTPFYWMDVNGVVLGINDLCLKAIGTTREIVGKKPYEFYKKEIADHILRHNAEVIRAGEILSQEEWIEDVTTKEKKCFSAIKAPLYDDEGRIIGIVGTSLEITAEKVAEALRLENEAHKAQLQEQEKFKTIADQVAHDIRSPVASLLMLIKSCQEIPENERIALREAATTISDIANNLLNKYQKKEGDDTPTANEIREPILVSARLLQMLTDKKYQYQELAIKFEHDFSQNGNFAFIKIEPTSFKRAISNIINNAVDALNKDGKITVKLDATSEWVTVTIQDNGQGMPAEVIDKIMQNIRVTAGKDQGHGIGLTQVRETLQRNQGELKIDSIAGKGTKIILTFPRVKAANWIGEEIVLGSEDTVVILDDDASIHGAWNAHFEVLLKDNPDVKLVHFESGKDALDYINNLSSEQKAKVFLLTDYELLKQELNGLDIIEQSNVKRSLLVTSHYTNAAVREQALKIGTKILPKQLASEIPIKFSNTSSKAKIEKLDLIIIDDDKSYTNNLLNYVLTDKEVVCFHDPAVFLNEALEYPKDTKICIDNNFEGAVKIKGLDIAKKLHEMGFTKLYLLSGDAFKKDELPDYITAAILKDDVGSITNI